MKKVFLIAAFAVAAVLGVSSQNQIQAQSGGKSQSNGNLVDGGDSIGCKKAKNTCYVVSTFTGDIVVKGVLTITL